MQINSAFTTTCEHGVIYYMFHQHLGWHKMSIFSSPSNTKAYRQLYIENDKDTLIASYANNFSLPSLYALSKA